jgi:hypothetical protein
VSTSLRSLQPWLVTPAEWLFKAGHGVDSSLVVTSARRSYAEQLALWNRFKAGNSPLPALPPGRSKHQLGRAFDMARPSVDPFADTLLAMLGVVWRKMGGFWHASDPVHFEA